jgi:hypothetical protein
VVTAFATAYAHYLSGRVPARRLADVSATMLATFQHTRAGALRLRVVSITRRAGGWTVLYAPLGQPAAAVIARVTLARTADGWEIARIEQPDLDQLTARHPTPPTPPAAVRAAVIAFTRGYLAYTYAHRSATTLTHVTARLRHRLTTPPPSVPASVRALDPRITRLVFVRTRTGRWLATAQVNDGVNRYAIESTLTHSGARWTVTHLTATG